MACIASTEPSLEGMAGELSLFAADFVVSTDAMMNWLEWQSIVYWDEGEFFKKFGMIVSIFTVTYFIDSYSF